MRRLERVRAFGRDPERREKFCREMSERIGVAVEPARSGEEAVKGADIVITATPATKIVLEGAWLAPGMHINAMGANWPQKRELDAAAVNRANKIVVDSIEQAKMEAGDLIQAFGEDQSRWNAVQELSQIVAGKEARQKRRRSNHIVQIEWDRNLGPCGRQARLRTGCRAGRGQNHSYPGKTCSARLQAGIVDSVGCPPEGGRYWHMNHREDIQNQDNSRKSMKSFASSNSARIARDRRLMP